MPLQQTPTTILDNPVTQGDIMQDVQAFSNENYNGIPPQMPIQQTPQDNPISQED